MGENSGVNLGRDTGTGLLDMPNTTNPASKNKVFGIRCFINSYANGRLGSLDGTLADKSFAADCVGSLLP